MDIVPLLFLLLIVLLSGVIALVADNLGRKLGKKRLWLKWKFLHLRPKHTAMAGVFLSGVVVSFLTITIIAALSSGVRDWIAQGYQARIKLEAAKKEVGVATKELAETRKLGAQQVAENLYLEKQVGEGNAKLLAQQKTIREQEATLKGLQNDIAQSTSKISGLEASLSGFNAKFATLARKRDAINKELGEKTKALVAVRKNLASVQATLTASTGMLQEITRRNADIEFKNGQLEKKNSTLQTSVSELEKKIPVLEESRRVLLEASRKAESELQATIDQLGDTQERLASAQSDFSALLAQYQKESQTTTLVSGTIQKTREEEMIYRRGQEVARTTVPANATPAQAKKALDTLLSISRTTAADRGAKSSGSFDAAGIVDHYDSRMGRTVPAEDIKASLIRQMTGLGESQVIVGTSTLNAFSGEPVSLEVSIFPNPLVYREGQVVAEAKVDGKKDQSEIFRQVQSLLSDRLTERAKQDRMIPRIGTDAEFGTVTATEILDLVDRVRKADRRVILRAIAETDTRAGDPLKIRFGIR